MEEILNMHGSSMQFLNRTLLMIFRCSKADEVVTRSAMAVWIPAYAGMIGIAVTSVATVEEP